MVNVEDLIPHGRAAGRRLEMIFRSALKVPVIGPGGQNRKRNPTP
jgi:hypothetical protein